MEGGGADVKIHFVRNAFSKSSHWGPKYKANQVKSAISTPSYNILVMD